MSGAVELGTDLILLRIFFSYTRRISFEGKPATTAELAITGKFSTKQKGSHIGCPYFTFAETAIFSRL